MKAVGGWTERPPKLDEAAWRKAAKAVEGATPAAGPSAPVSAKPLTVKELHELPVAGVPHGDPSPLAGTTRLLFVDRKGNSFCELSAAGAAPRASCAALPKGKLDGLRAGAPGAPPILSSTYLHLSSDGKLVRLEGSGSYRGRAWSTTGGVVWLLDLEPTPTRSATPEPRE